MMFDFTSGQPAGIVHPGPPIVSASRSMMDESRHVQHGRSKMRFLIQPVCALGSSVLLIGCLVAPADRRERAAEVLDLKERFMPVLSGLDREAARRSEVYYPRL